MTGPSRLSSLLVRDGLVPVKRMEQAFQRQVIYGGTLDTILLEMNAVPEDRLTEYLSLATGLPLAQRDLTDYFDPRAAQLCPVGVAEQYHVAPVAFDGTALRVLVTDPVDLATLEALATQLSSPIQPFVVLEYRFQLVIERIFGISTSPRYVALASRAAPASTRPVTSEPKVVVAREVGPPPAAAVPEEIEAADSRRPTMLFSSDDVADAIAEQRRRLEDEATPREIPRPRFQDTQPFGIPIAAPVQPLPAAVSAPTAYDAIEISDGTDEHRPIAASGETEGPAPGVARDDAVPEPAETVQTTAYEPPSPPPASFARASWRGGGILIDPAPLEPAEASAALSEAEDRDQVFAALVRGARSRARYAAALIVQGGQAFGRMAIDAYEAEADEIARVMMTLAQYEAFSTAVNGRAPYIGPVATGVVELDQVLARMGGVVPPAALLLPVAIRDRVVALVYAHRGAESISIAEVAEVLSLAGDAAMALSRLILKIKAQGYRRVETSEPEAAPPLPIDDLPSKRDDAKAAAGGWGRAQADPEAKPIDLDDPRHAAQATRSAGSLLDVIESGHESAAGAATEEALARTEEILGELRGRFPGKLWVDRYATAGRSARASQHGPLLALLVRIGARSAPLLNEHMSSQDREVRYYATLTCAEVRSPLLVPGLVARLFDGDYGVRAAALDALIGYPAFEVDASLDIVRRALHSDVAKARAAAHALGELRDVRAVPDLIDACDRDHTTAEEARRALVVLTKQDFGIKAKKWRAWFEKNKDRPRMEWMLDGLAHAEDEVRLSASEELKRLTGEYFGYHYDLPKREREEARQRWIKWWEETGRRRFLREGKEERNRPTAVLPSLRGRDS